jgi:hypothetical protein
VEILIRSARLGLKPQAPLGGCTRGIGRIAGPAAVVFTDAIWNPTKPAEVDTTAVMKQMPQVTAVTIIPVAWQSNLIASVGSSCAVIARWKQLRKA